MKNNKVLTSAVAVMLLLASVAGTAACVRDDTSEEQITSNDTAQTESETEINYDKLDVSKYVGEVKYTGFRIVLDNSDASKEDALWDAILAANKITAYPEDKVEYYFRQKKQAYMYLVKGNEEDYKTLLESRNIDDEDLRDEARKLVKKDLVYYYIVRKENISVTDEEKSKLFDKYVEEYVSAYGYKKEYVKENMTDIIYESMLYDKTMEYLLQNNTFETAEDTTEKAE